MRIDRSPSRTGHLAAATAALVALAVLVVGVPFGLATVVGWPLPRHVPNVAGIHSALTTRGIPDQTLLDALACVAWLAWISLVLSVAEEALAAARGRGARRIPLAGAFQPAAARLVGLLLLSTLALARPQSAALPPVRTPLAVQLNPNTVMSAADIPVTAAPLSQVLSTPSVSPPARPATPVTYAVVRHDTLWSIAQTQLGDPLRWREIFTLNEQRIQPDDRTLTDPSWIYPGWVLVIPVGTPTPSQPTAPVPAVPAPATPSHATPTSTAPPTGTTTTTPPAWPVGTGSTGAAANGRSSQPMVLSSGSVVAPSFAAGVLAAVAVGRLRRRRRYRPSEPRPGRDLRRPHLGRTLRDLRQSAAGQIPMDVEPSGSPDPPLSPMTRRLPPDISAIPKPSLTPKPGPPGCLEIGIREDESVFLDLTPLGALSIAGPTTDDVVRAWCAALLTAAGPGAAEILTTTRLAASLLPGLHPTTALRAVDSSGALLRMVEAEIVGRTRQLDDADLPNAASYRAARPEDPLPFLLAIVDQVPDPAADRWRAVSDSAARLDVAVIVLSSRKPFAEQITIDATRTVTSASTEELIDLLQEATLFGLDRYEAVELVDALTAAYDEASSDDEADGLDRDRPADQVPEELDEKWPVEAMTPCVDGLKPIQVRLLGPYQITAHGQEITKGLRSAGKELLAWFLLRPEGASSEASVDALWPDTSPELVTKRFWRALGDLRTRLRSDHSSEKVEVLIRSGDHYHPELDKITCDLWDFQRHLSEAARAHDVSEVACALRAAVDVYRGDFATDADYLWVGPVREDLHRRALDAHLRLAEAEEESGNQAAAIEALSHAIQLDQYAEEVFRRLMALQGRTGRIDSVAATLRQLERNLANVELDPEPATVLLHNELTRAWNLGEQAMSPWILGHSLPEENLFQP